MVGDVAAVDVDVFLKMMSESNRSKLMKIKVFLLEKKAISRRLFKKKGLETC